MEIREDIYFIIAACAVVTIVMRVCPIVMLSRVKLPDWADDWLKLIPISIMTSIVVQELFIHEDQFSLNISTVLVSLLCIGVGWVTNSLFTTVLIGVLAIYGLGFLGW